MQPLGVEKESIVERVVDLLQQTADSKGVPLPSDSESLFKSQVLDSFGMLEFLTAIEDQLSIKIPDEDLVPSNFDTIAKIKTYINCRLRR